jgi:hypothetical protein
VALIDALRPERSIDLSPTVARLPGLGGDGGRFDAVWAEEARQGGPSLREGGAGRLALKTS